MTPFEEQLQALVQEYPGTSATPVAGGSQLIQIPNFRMPKGWNREVVTILFLAPPGFPAAQPDCFWVEPGGVRVANSGTPPQSTNETNQIPGVGPRGTWFSWHLQSWNPNRDSLLTFVNVVKQRLDPPR